jgi:hypothetical protein
MSGQSGRKATPDHRPRLGQFPLPGAARKDKIHKFRQYLAWIQWLPGNAGRRAGIR